MNSVTVQVHIASGHKGQKRLEVGAEPPPPPESVPRVARLLALAHHWRGLIGDGTVRDQADIARLVGVSRARVTQVLQLLHLAPDIQEVVLAANATLPLAERVLRRIAAEPVWHEQRTAFPS